MVLEERWFRMEETSKRGELEVEDNSRPEVV